MRNFLNIFKILKFFNFLPGGNVELLINGSSITFMRSGDIHISAARHIITERDLSFDNCPRDFVQGAILAKSASPEIYNEYIENKQKELSNDTECCPH